MCAHPRSISTAFTALGPKRSLTLFVQGGAFGGAKLLTGADNPGQPRINDHDLLRAPNGRAIIGDPRNDENRIISQIQLAIIRFHNLVSTRSTLRKALKATISTKKRAAPRPGITNGRW
ncbi:MAG: hypothetical protein HRT64_10495 [Erythrobacter sp.]|nr:hypothetical protein [Erythrobacter sp.]